MIRISRHLLTLIFFVKRISRRITSQSFRGTPHHIFGCHLFQFCSIILIILRHWLSFIARFLIMSPFTLRKLLIGRLIMMHHHRNLRSHRSIILIWLPTIIILVIGHLITMIRLKALWYIVLTVALILIISCNKHVLCLLISKSLMLLLRQYHTVIHHWLILISSCTPCRNLAIVVHNFSKDFFQFLAQLSFASWALTLRAKSVIHNASYTTDETRGAAQLLELFIIAMTNGALRKDVVIVHKQAVALIFIYSKFLIGVNSAKIQNIGYTQNKIQPILNEIIELYQYLDQMRKNKRRCRTDGDNAYLTFNVDTSLPFVMKSPNSFQNLSHPNSLSNSQKNSFNTVLKEVENSKSSQTNGSGEFFKQSSQNLIDKTYRNHMNPQNHSYSQNQTYFAQSLIKLSPFQAVQQHGYLTQEQKEYLKYKNSPQYHQNNEIQLEPRQKQQMLYTQSNIHYVETKLKILPKITFLNHFIQKIMGRLFRKQTQLKEDFCKAQKKQNNMKLIQSQFIKMTKKPSPITFEPLNRRTGPNPRCHVRKEKIHQFFRVVYQIDEVLDTCEKFEKKRGSFDVGEINPYIDRTKQFLIKWVVEKCSGVKKHIVQDIEIIESQSIVLIKVCCIVKPFIISNHVQCTFLTLQQNVVTGLRLYTPEVQISFNSAVCLDKVELKLQLSIDNYCIKMKQNLDRNISILFRNLQMNINSQSQFITFFKINCWELSENFVDYLYVAYLNMGAVSI